MVKFWSPFIRIKGLKQREFHCCAHWPIWENWSFSFSWFLRRPVNNSLVSLTWLTPFWFLAWSVLRNLAKTMAPYKFHLTQTNLICKSTSQWFTNILSIIEKNILSIILCPLHVWWFKPSLPVSWLSCDVLFPIPCPAMSHLFIKASEVSL
jgi:hypothetical protein